MGSFGSGRNYYATTPDVEACRNIDSDLFSDSIDAPDGSLIEISWSSDTSIRAIVVNGEGGEHADALRFEYTTRPDTDDAEQHEYQVALDYTEPHFGGVRAWFRCPHCHQRRGKLYLPPGEVRFACRECYGLQYRSSRDSGNEMNRARQRYKKAFARADKDNRTPHPNDLVGSPEKPKGMHQETFEQLKDDVREARDEWAETFREGLAKYDGDSPRDT